MFSDDSENDSNETLDKLEFDIDYDDYINLKKYLTISNKKILNQYKYKIQINDNEIPVSVRQIVYDLYSVTVSINDAKNFYKYMVKQKIHVELDRESYAALIKNDLMDLFEYFIVTINLDSCDFVLRSAVKLSNENAVSMILNATHIYISAGFLCRIFFDRCHKMSPCLIKIFLNKLMQYDRFVNPTCYDKRRQKELLERIIINDEPEKLQLFVDSGININKYSNHLYKFALAHQLENILFFLVKNQYPIKPSVDLRNYIDSYAKQDASMIVELLLELCCDKQKWLNDVLAKSEKYSVDIVQMIVDSGANIDKLGLKLYHKAKNNKNYELCTYLKQFVTG